MNATDEATPPTPPPQEPQPGTPRLTRSTDDKILTGLCGGLGRHFGIDPVVFRIAFVVLALAGGTGVLLYLAGWLVIPEDGSPTTYRTLSPRHQKVALGVLAVVGALMLIDDIDSDNDVPLALVLVAVGATILWSRRHSRPVQGRAPTGATPTPPLVRPETPGDWVSPEVAAPREPSTLVPATLSGLVVLAGVLALLGVSLVTGLALALIITGAALVVGAWRGRARALIPVAVLLSVALCLASVIDVPLGRGVGERRFRPITVADLDSPYRLAIGPLIVDLAALDLDAGTSTVRASVAVGELVVIVPENVSVTATAHAGAGEVELFDAKSDGTSVDERATLEGDGPGRLVVDARVGIGRVEVRRATA